MYLEIGDGDKSEIRRREGEPWDMPPTSSCALDHANAEHTLEEIAEIIGVTRERVRQIEEMALAKVALESPNAVLRDNLSPHEYVHLRILRGD
jgi:sigma-70-like protein